MENASKALIIAGTIIIVMIVIAAGMYLFNSAGGLSSSVQSKWSDDEILNFNRQFTKYEGTQKGSVVKELIETVNRSNERSEVRVSFNKTYVNVSNNVFYANSQLINGKTYKISFGDKVDGVITSIKIEGIN